MRVLDRSVVSLDLNKVGFDAGTTLKTVSQMIHKPNGIILVTGPTGSGKTTTLYSALSELNEIEDKLITTEDPVEYDIDGIVQVPSIADIGNTFAACLRAILRQDPDIDPRRRDPRLGNGRNRGAEHPSPGTPCSARCTPTTRRARSRGYQGHGHCAVFDHGHGRRRSWPSGWCAGSARNAASHTRPAAKVLARYWN